MQNSMLMSISGVVLIVMNLISFGLMAYDKRCAAKGKWRVPERTLFLAAALFGGLGGVLGMQLLRHKTRHWYFVYGMPAILLLQLLIAWIAVRGI